MISLLHLFVNTENRTCQPIILINVTKLLPLLTIVLQRRASKGRRRERITKISRQNWIGVKQAIALWIITDEALAQDGAWSQAMGHLPVAP